MIRCLLSNLKWDRAGQACPMFDLSCEPDQIPCHIMASATFRKPAMLAPAA